MVEQASAEADPVSAAASALSAKGASKGGQARASKTTATERSEIARAAAHARWQGKKPKATHTGVMKFGDREIHCAVLEDGTRLISITSFLAALGRPRMGRKDAVLPVLQANNLQPFISDELRELASTPVAHASSQHGNHAWGYPAQILPGVCEVYLDARSAGALTTQQQSVANAAEILIRGMARTGIVALIDEATGYQEVRARDELQRILESYVQAELRPWIKMFPDEFFQEIYRLEGWQYKPGTSKRTPYVGKLINHYIYDQLPPGVREELERLNPRNEKGNRTRRHHQFLTPGTGHAHLDRQISTVTTLMRISENKQQFTELFERAFPPPQTKLPLEIDVSAPDGVVTS